MDVKGLLGIGSEVHSHRLGTRLRIAEPVALGDRNATKEGKLLDHQAVLLAHDVAEDSVRFPII